MTTKGYRPACLQGTRPSLAAKFRAQSRLVSIGLKRLTDAGVITCCPDDAVLASDSYQGEVSFISQCLLNFQPSDKSRNPSGLSFSIYIFLCA
jgi:hypothetical protein